MKTDEQSKVDLILEKRSTFLRDLQDTYRLDVLGLKRLEKTITSLVAPAVAASRLQAALQHELAYTAGMSRNLDRALAGLAKSRHLGMDEFSTALSTSHILMMNGHFLDASAIIQKQLQSKVSADQMPFLIPHMLEVGMVATAHGLMAEEYTDKTLAADCRSILQRIGATENDLTQRLDFAARLVLSFADHPIIGYNLLADKAEGILYEFTVDAGPEALSRLEDRLNDGLVDAFEGALDGVLAIGVAPFHPEHVTPQGHPYRVSI